MKIELGKLIARFASDPKAMSIFRELESCRVQAGAVNLLAEFDLIWDYELAKFKELPCRAPEPKQVLQTMLKVAHGDGGPRTPPPPKPRR
jgi:hypothetical protein